MKKIFLSATIEVQVPFYDADMMHIVWHGNYVKYFEDARCALLEKFGFNYLEMGKTGFAWPIVDMRLKYVKPAKFTDVICVTANLVEVHNCLKIEYLITNKKTEETLTRGYTVQTAVEMESNEMQFTSPEILLTKLKEHGVEI